MFEAMHRHYHRIVVRFFKSAQPDLNISPIRGNTTFVFESILKERVKCFRIDSLMQDRDHDSEPNQ